MQMSHQTAKQADFFSIFDAAPAAVKMPTIQKTATAHIAPQTAPQTTPEPVVVTFVTERMREILRTSPFASFVRGKSLAEINELSETFDTRLWKKRDTPHGERQLADWREASGAAHAIALEAEYKKVDERFCLRETGEFVLVNGEGNRQTITYKYDPFPFCSTNTHTSIFTHHIEFDSFKVPNEITETGYRSHFFNGIPYLDVVDFADWLVKTLRIALNVKSTIIFEEQSFKFDERLYPAPPKKEKAKKCPECDSRLDRDGDCLECSFTTLSDEERAEMRQNDGDSDGDGDYTSEEEEEDYDLFSDDDE